MEETESSASEARYLALDPGDTIGYATFREDGSLLAMGQFRREAFLKEIEDLLQPQIKVCIVEDYRNYGHKQQKRWSRNDTSKVIGKIEVFAELRGVRVVLQPANKYPIGAKWGGFEIPSNHDISHQFVAAAHGIFYLQTIGVRTPGQAIMNRGNND